MFNNEKPINIIILNYVSNKVLVNQINMSMSCTICKPMYDKRLIPGND